MNKSCAINPDKFRLFLKSVVFILVLSQLSSLFLVSGAEAVGLERDLESHVSEREVLIRQVQCSSDRYAGQYHHFGQIGVLELSESSALELNSYWFASQSGYPLLEKTRSEKLCEKIFGQRGHVVRIKVRGRQLVDVEVSIIN